MNSPLSAATAAALPITDVDTACLFDLPPRVVAIEDGSDEPPVSSKQEKRRAAPAGSVIEVAIDQIKIGKRIRKDIGDLTSLAEGIGDEGLLQLIGVDPNMTLVFGYRRFLAYRDVLGRKTISVRIVEVSSILAGEIAENILRKDFTVSERVAIGQLIEKQMPERRGRGKRQNPDGLSGRTDDFAAKRAGLGSRNTYRQAKKVIEFCTPEVIDAVDKGDLSISAAFVLAEVEPDLQNAALKKSNNLERMTENRVKKNLRRAKRAKEEVEAAKRPIRIPKPTDAIKILHSDFRKLKIKDESVDLMFTDPLYAREFLPLWGDLSAFAARVLKPNGILATYSGTFHLIDGVLPQLQKHMHPIYMASTFWNGDRNLIHPLNVRNGWKPIIICLKKEAEWEKRKPWSDTGFGAEKQKGYSVYQQNLEEVTYFVRALSKPGDLICDPFGGGFTTAAAVQKVGDRRFIGCDIEKDCAVKGQERIQKASESDDRNCSP